LQSEPITVWWDTFHVSLVNTNTETSGAATVTVNATYLLLPEEGLTLPDYATYSHQTFLPKIVHGATVTINGVEAEESSVAGIYTAKVPCWFSTSYIHVEVSQEGWTTTHTGFSFAHNSNRPFWIGGVLIASAFILGAFVLRYVSLRKTKRPDAFKQCFPFFGGTLLAAASVISLYWALIGIDGTFHGFDWSSLAVLELISFGLGFTGAVLSLRRKNQTLILFTVCLPLIANLVPVHTSLESYQLAIPWVNLTAALTIAIASGFLIANANEQFH
jgi:predicted outer membrane lipoprotein